MCFGWCRLWPFASNVKVTESFDIARVVLPSSVLTVTVLFMLTSVEEILETET